LLISLAACFFAIIPVFYVVPLSGPDVPCDPLIAFFPSIRGATLSFYYALQARGHLCVCQLRS
jgi:hypothetical protein